jgi:hypothetical protein
MGIGDQPVINQAPGSPRAVQKGSVFTVVVPTKNYGVTPAGGVTNRINMHIFCGDFPNDPPYKNAPNDFGVQSRSSYMPGQAAYIGPAQLDNNPMTAPEWASLIDKTCHLYVYAKSRYCDIFGVEHYRHYCAEWMPDPQGGATFAFCNSYNDGDEDYPNKKETKCSLGN